MNASCARIFWRVKWPRSSVLVAAVACITCLTGCSTNGGTNGNENDNANMNDNGNGRETFTVTFDGDAGATSSGTTDFGFQGATFSGGTVRTLGDFSLYGSGLFGYEVLEGRTVTVAFDNPVDLLDTFLVTRGGGEAVLTAFDAEGNAVGTVTGVASAGIGAAENFREVDLSAAAMRVEVVYSGPGEGWLDEFSFRFAENGGA